MLENPFIKNLKVGNDFKGIFALRKKELLAFGDSFRLVVDIADSTGHLQGVMWENAEETYHKVETNRPVEITGKVGTFRGVSQITIERLKIAVVDSVDPYRFLPSSPNNSDQQGKRLLTIIEGLRNPHLKTLLQMIFNEDKFLQRFIKAPGGKQWHHAYLGGLVDHVLDQCALAESVAALYPELDRDLLMCGVILHDIGKVYELEIGCTIEYSTRGRLVGHLVIGASLVERAIKNIDDFPKELGWRLEHLILAHHDSSEYGSPVPPMIPEAIVLHHIDEIDAKLNALNKIKESETSLDNPWSSYNKLLDRFLYLNPPEYSTE
jgi:3'-5' exoribonuclease